MFKSPAGVNAENINDTGYLVVSHGPTHNDFWASIFIRYLYYLFIPPGVLSPSIPHPPTEPAYINTFIILPQSTMYVKPSIFKFVVSYTNREINYILINQLFSLARNILYNLEQRLLIFFF